MRFIDLFAGIGGISLGLERAGHACVGQVEIDDYCTRVLERHWPDVPRWRDIREVTGAELPAADLWTAGFPCQDISDAGKAVGISGTRSGLWREFVRALRVVRPSHTLLENVAGLLHRGMGTVLGDLAESRHDACWDCLPACAFGARHIRDRVFIASTARALDFADCFAPRGDDRRPESVRRWLQDIGIRRCLGWGPWAAQSPMDRTAYGVPRSVDRKCLLGNAVVPQVAEYIGRLLAGAKEADGK